MGKELLDGASVADRNFDAEMQILRTATRAEILKRVAEDLKNIRGLKQEKRQAEFAAVLYFFGFTPFVRTVPKESEESALKILEGVLNLADGYCQQELAVWLVRTRATIDARRSLPGHELLYEMACSFDQQGPLRRLRQRIFV